MPPKVSDQKRKRGRPPGASKSKGDASSHEAPNHDAEPDPEERARPRKRGRKNEAEGAGTEPGPSRNENGLVQPPKAGRPPKKSQHTAKADILRETEEQDRRSNAKEKARSDDSTEPLKGKRKTAPQIKPREERQQPESSEARRSTRVPGRSEAPASEQQAPSQERSTERAPKRADGTSSGPSKDKRKASTGKEKATASQTSPKDDEPSASAPRRSGRDRRMREPYSVPSGSRQNDQQDGQPTAIRHSGKSRTRANGASREAASPKAQQNHPATEIGKKRRGRPSLSKEDSESARALQPQQGNRAKAPRESSEADKTSDESRSIEDLRPKRRGRPRQSDSASQEPEPAQPPRSRGRPRRRSPEAAEEQEQEQISTKKNRKKRQPPQLEPVVEEEEGEDEDASSDEDEPEFPFRSLKESTKNIPRSVISEKWGALDGPSINAVGTFLADAQRPVLLRLQNTSRRREHASAALSGISRRLHTKLVRGLPFPAPTAGPTRRAAPGSHEGDFDFERAVNAVQGLENTLNPLLHSVSLLEREIKKEEDALARDYDTLHKLEANARSEAKGWREKAKREHVLASGIRRKGEGVDYLEEDDRLELIARPEAAVTGGLFKDLDDEELVTLSKQIGSHMESMQGNLHQIGFVVPAISRSKAALQQVMQEHLDEEQYDKVLLG
ncbi:hypothetical protein LA080_012159 [Diaporthe eres]|uniref:Kinetochore protein fta7 n=1 Tax=Diaporthe vaccinii TaxID=105482 RepID=A0ABR4FFW7_9PEZI|nr:hypothetical protein LA080_012159 [Diaporthe eres]